jgi:hypothetical protein
MRRSRKSEGSVMAGQRGRQNTRIVIHSIDIVLPCVLAQVLGQLAIDSIPVNCG